MNSITITSADTSGDKLELINEDGKAYIKSTNLLGAFAVVELTPESVKTIHTWLGWELAENPMPASELKLNV